MSPRTRMILAGIGLLLIFLSLLALAYAWQPAPIHAEQITIAPTLFNPPGVLP